ncbi:hypothetical protein [Photorhabdus asymbiotica]
MTVSDSEATGKQGKESGGSPVEEPISGLQYESSEKDDATDSPEKHGPAA